MKMLIQATLAHGVDVRELRLRHPQGSTLPTWPAGAHLKLHLPQADGSTLARHYSLIGTPGDTQQYRIAVLKDPKSRGGSRQVHEQLSAGQTLEVEGPFNSFPLKAGAGRIVLVAGGIGITPLHAMAHELNRQGLGFELHYLARSEDRLVLLDELRALPQAQIHLHLGAAPPDLAALLGPFQSGHTLHACGPVPLLNALREHAAAQGWPATAQHFESFGARVEGADRPIRLHLAQSGISLEVPVGTSLLDALIQADQFVSFECKRGECGQCWTPVVAGEPLHRDVCLTPAQRAQGLCTCVGWARSAELTLDL